MFPLLMYFLTGGLNCLPYFTSLLVIILLSGDSTHCRPAGSGNFSLADGTTLVCSPSEGGLICPRGETNHLDLRHVVNKEDD